MPIFMRSEATPIGVKGGQAIDTREACLIAQIARGASLNQTFTCLQCENHRGSALNEIVQAPAGRRSCRFRLDQEGKIPVGIDIK